MSHVARSVRLSVIELVTLVLCKNGWTNRDVVWGGGCLAFPRPKKPCFRCGPASPTGRGNFGSCLAHSKTMVVCVAVYTTKGIIRSSVTACSKRDHSSLNNGMTAVRLLQPTAVLPTSQCHITFSPVKNSPTLSWGLSSNVYDHLLLLLQMKLL